MIFRLQIRTDNAAFDGDNLIPEVVTILRHAAERIETGATGALLRDSNGNIIGEFAFTADHNGD